MSVSTISAASATSSTAASEATEKATLNRLMATYRTNIQRGEPATQLKSMAQQITNLAKSLGQTVNLPTANATSTASNSGVTNTTAANQGGTSKMPPAYA
jgi:hypothetical protein